MKQLWAAIFLSSVIGLLVATGLHLVFPDKEEIEWLVIFSFTLTMINGMMFAKEYENGDDE